MTTHICPHPRSRHRHGGYGRCEVAGCRCLFGPPLPARTTPPEPRPRALVTTDQDGVVVDFKRPSKRTRLEDMLWRRIRDADLPMPELEYRFALAIGRQFRADGFYPPDVLLEVEGGIWAPNAGRHNRGSGFQDDAEKYNLAAILGFRVLRFTERMIKDGTAVDHIRRALERRQPDSQLTLPGGDVADAS